jgi:hypothetical protein
LKTRIVILILIYMATLYKTTQGKTRHAEIVATIDGDTLYQVLPPDAIPAIRQPSFLQGSEARAQMSDAEMVIGIQFDGEARAYSLWQLDAHEIVNDHIGDIKFAVTW